MKLQTKPTKSHSRIFIRQYESNTQLLARRTPTSTHIDFESSLTSLFYRRHKYSIKTNRRSTSLRTKPARASRPRPTIKFKFSNRYAMGLTDICVCMLTYIYSMYILSHTVHYTFSFINTLNQRRDIFTSLKSFADWRNIACCR